jgi:hypothetical protein
MSITRTCNGCGETIPVEVAGALTVQRDANPGHLRTPGLAALDRTDWCPRCAAPILAVLGESLTRARRARERRAISERARSVELTSTTVEAAKKNLTKKGHLRLTP